MKYFTLVIAIIFLSLPAPALAQDAPSQEALEETPEQSLSTLYGQDAAAEAFVPPYQQDIEMFNDIPDEEILAEIMPEESAPPPQEPDKPAALFNRPAAPKNSNDPQKQFSVNSEDLELYSQVPQDVLDDAQDFFEVCERDQNMSTHYECRCMAKAYLDKAIEAGPGYSRTTVVSQLQNYCPNLPKMAGVTYQRCLREGIIMPENQTMDEYCACFGNEYARQMARLTIPMGTRKIKAARMQAIEKCRN